MRSRLIQQITLRSSGIILTRPYFPNSGARFVPLISRYHVSYRRTGCRLYDALSAATNLFIVGEETVKLRLLRPTPQIVSHPGPFSDVLLCSCDLASRSTRRLGRHVSTMTFTVDSFLGAIFQRRMANAPDDGHHLVGANLSYGVVHSHQCRALTINP